jgi:hypothetical protein
MKRIKVEETDSWQKPILSISNNGTATKGNRYIVGDTPTGEFSGLTTDSIATYDGSAWLEDMPEEGWLAYDLNQNLLLIYESSSWAALSIGTSTNFDTVDTPQDLEDLDENIGDWAFVNNISQHVVYLGASEGWRKLGNLVQLITGAGNLYGEAAHYDASAITGKSDGDAVTSWEDQSGNNYDAAAPTTGPTYKVSIVNGYPILRFSGNSDEQLRITGKIFGNVPDDELTIVAVSKLSSSSVCALLSTRPSSGSEGFLLRYSDETTILYSHIGYGSGTFTITDQFNVIWIRRNADDDIDGGVNSTSDILSASPTDFAANTSDTWTQIATESNGSNPFDGDIAEIFIFESAINNTLLGTVIADLKTKYNIT